MTENTAKILKYVSHGNAEAKCVSMSFEAAIKNGKKPQKTGDEIVSEVLDFWFPKGSEKK